MICLTPQLCAVSQKGGARADPRHYHKLKDEARECHLLTLPELDIEGVTSTSKGTWRCFSNSPDWPISAPEWRRCSTFRPPPFFGERDRDTTNQVW
jgi:hypothetical protein